MSQRKIQRDIKLAGEISDEAAERIFETVVAIKPKQVARLAYETQLKLANEINGKRANDVRKAEASLKICTEGGATSPTEFQSRIRSSWFELDQANQRGSFHNAVNQPTENLSELIQRVEAINDLATNWLDYY